jgi:Ca2+-transporting ATPase
MPDATRGLTDEQVLASRAAHGTNVLTPPPRTPLWKRYLQKFDDPVIRILMIAAGIAIAVGAMDGHAAEGFGILVAIFLATFLAFWNELRAAREFDILNTSSDDVAVKVVRDGSYRHIPKRDVVVGDCVFVEVGEEIPADGTLADAVGLTVNESRLTGEAVPAEKAPGEPVHRGTTVAEGYGICSITAVGDRTEIGRTLRESIEDSGEDSPLKKQLAKLSRIIGVVGFGIASLAFAGLLAHGLMVGTILWHPGEVYFFAAIAVSLAVGLVNVWLPISFDALELMGLAPRRPAWLGEGKSWMVSLLAGGIVFAAMVGAGIAGSMLQADPATWIDRSDARQLVRNFMIAVTIIVVAVPEGLAMSVTLSLAYSMRKMTATNTLVRKMDACETIGAVTVICSDKTGTLTYNEMRLFEAEIASVATASLPTESTLRSRVIEAIAANTTAHLARVPGQPSQAVGNPTEGALLLWLEGQGVDYQAARNAFDVREQWGFNTERKFMATLGSVLHIKGAPEIVLERCGFIATQDGNRPLEIEEIARIRASLKKYQSRGMRTLALAYREENVGSALDENQFRDLTWLGCIAIADPIRKEVPDAIAACRRAGVDVKIVTGDNQETAGEIARQIGLDDSRNPLTGPEFAAMNDKDAREAAHTLHVLARARPSDKLRLVRLLKARGEVVAVTGDGVNDGPALNYADVGLAMGLTGTSVAREASDIVLLDDSFPSIVNAMRWGRTLYENIQRFIVFQLTINVVALGLAVSGPFLGFELPLTVMQMLWVNLIMDTFAALALATEPPHQGVLHRPPRSPKAFIVTRAMAWSIFGAGAAFLAVLLGYILVVKGQGGFANEDAPARDSTLLFTGFVLLQFWNLFNAKAMGRSGSVLPMLGGNKSFLAIAAVILAGQFLIVQFGGEVFRTVPLGVTDWLVLLGLTSTVLWVGEIARWWKGRE